MSATEEKKLTDKLTTRQLEVLKLLSEGYTNKEISVRLQISLGTVENHIHKMMARMGANNRTSAAAIYYRERG